MRIIDALWEQVYSKFPDGSGHDEFNRKPWHSLSVVVFVIIGGVLEHFWNLRSLSCRNEGSREEVIVLANYSWFLLPMYD